MEQGDTPLVDAARRGGAADVETLLTNGADVNQADDRGVTPLITSCARGHGTSLRSGARDILHSK